VFFLVALPAEINTVLLLLFCEFSKGQSPEQKRFYQKLAPMAEPTLSSNDSPRNSAQFDDGQNTLNTNASSSSSSSSSLFTSNTTTNATPTTDILILKTGYLMRKSSFLKRWKKLYWWVQLIFISWASLKLW
jgi:hypothetical protein